MKQSVALVGVQTGIDVVLREDILTNLKRPKYVYVMMTRCLVTVQPEG